MEKTIQSQRRPELSKAYSKLGDSKLGLTSSLFEQNFLHSESSMAVERRITSANSTQGFDYSTTATKNNWEPRGMLQPKQKIEDSTKGEEMQRLQRLRRGRTRRRLVSPHRNEAAPRLPAWEKALLRLPAGEPPHSLAVSFSREERQLRIGKANIDININR
ncbi:hypothetical protein B296_00040883 [Ensete ventricosum]|uniref:Uncharacterized protein n=1 Tax=Ensete ventricosum TaxID=4639 RepID=A0A426XL65_ENSVE|nr:hypothetical protein B296_00040883 [Ensete ventricosum]